MNTVYGEVDMDKVLGHDKLYLKVDYVNGEKETSIIRRTSNGTFMGTVASIKGTDNLDLLLIRYLFNTDRVKSDIKNWRDNDLDKQIKGIRNGGKESLFKKDGYVYLLIVQHDRIGNANVSVEKTPEGLVESGYKQYKSSAGVLRGAVSGIYKTLRTVAIMFLLTILVYAGIRMVLASVSKDKLKYRKLLMDWFVALILVFAMHYIMSAIINISQILTGVIEGSSIENVLLQIPNGTKVLNSDGEEERLDGGDESKDFWSTNFLGVTRFYVGLVEKKGFTTKGFAYTLMYLVSVIYLVIFTFQYIKRVLYMAFLTMISPLVAITYPIDKVHDGKAQGFSLWLKEYIFNALLQPIHCIIYVIVIGSVMQLVVDYPLYGLVALGFMVPAEKFIRKLFGFEKASTVGGFGAMAGTAALMGGIQKLTHAARPRVSSNDGEKQKLQDNNGNRGIKTIDSIPSLNAGNNEYTQSSNPGLQTGGNSSKPGLDWNLDEKNEADYISAEEKMQIGDNAYQEYKNSHPTSQEEEEQELMESMHGDEYASVEDWKNDKDSDYADVAEKMGWKETPKQEPQQTIPEKKTLTKREQFKNGVKSMSGHYARKVKGAVKKMHPIRALRRGLTFGAGAVTLGTIGLAAGIASGDPSKALQYTATGGVVGGNLGRNVGEKAINAADVKGGVEAFKVGALGDKHAEKEREKYKGIFKNNVANYDAAIRRVALDGWKDMSKNGGIIDKSLDYGITDVDTMCNIYKTQQKFIERGMNPESAATSAFRAYKLNEEFGDYSKNSKTQENLDKVLGSKGYSDQIKDRTKKEITSLIDVYRKCSRE